MSRKNKYRPRPKRCEKCGDKMVWDPIELATSFRARRHCGEGCRSAAVSKPDPTPEEIQAALAEIDQKVHARAQARTKWNRETVRPGRRGKMPGLRGRGRGDSNA